MRALGKHALQQVDSSDLVALDELTSQVTGVPLAYGRREKVRATVLSGGK